MDVAIRISSCAGASSRLLLRMVSCTCANTVQICSPTIDAVSAVAELPRPVVLVIDEARPTKRLESLLRTMGRRGSRIFHRGKLRDISIATIVCTAVPLSDGWICDQGIQIAVGPMRIPSASLSAQALAAAEARFKARLA